MGRILEHWRVPVAGLFAAVLVIGAYLFARGVESPSRAQASAETELLKAIAAKDSDKDGLPDWEEALYGTDPRAVDSNNLGMTDGEAVAQGLIVPKAIADISVATSSPGTSFVGDSSLPAAPGEDTITAAFAKNFFSLYLAAKTANGGADLSEDDLMNISNQALESLSSAVTTAPDFKSAHDLAIAGSGADALKAFAIGAEAVLVANTSTATTSEINYLRYAVEGDDPAALAHILSIAAAYRKSAAGLAVLSVPRELAADNLALINAMARVGEITTDFARIETDPMATMLALQQYPQAVLALGTAFINIGNIYATAGISLSAGEPGASFVNLIKDVAQQQAAASTP